jgi:hypothetical protein
MVRKKKATAETAGTPVAASEARQAPRCKAPASLAEVVAASRIAAGCEVACWLRFEPPCPPRAPTAPQFWRLRPLRSSQTSYSPSTPWRSSMRCRAPRGFTLSTPRSSSPWAHRAHRQTCRTAHLHVTVRGRSHSHVTLLADSVPLLRRDAVRRSRSGVTGCVPCTAGPPRRQTLSTP